MAQLTEVLSKDLLAGFGLPVGEHRLVTTARAAAEAAAGFGAKVAVKAQVPAGGRGKAGAIIPASSPAAAAAAFEQVTAAAVDGLRPTSALIEPWRRPSAEAYLGVTFDPELQEPVLLFSASGGVDVEGGGAVRLPLAPDGGLDAGALASLLAEAGPWAAAADAFVAAAAGLVEAFSALDARLVEVNPLALLESGRLLAMDARVVLDDHALFRHPDLRSLIEAMSPRPPEDLVRDATRLEYVPLEGELGLVSGGAGMTMAVMDLIRQEGASAACFLDCSANPTAEGYGAAFDLLAADPKVEAVLVSIFGGLTQMDRVARTLSELLRSRGPGRPVTLRLMGTNVEAAEAVLAAAGLVNHRQLESAVRAAVASLPASREALS